MTMASQRAEINYLRVGARDANLPSTNKTLEDPLYIRAPIRRRCQPWPAPWIVVIIVVWVVALTLNRLKRRGLSK